MAIPISLCYFLHSEGRLLHPPPVTCIRRMEVTAPKPQRKAGKNGGGHPSHSCGISFLTSNSKRERDTDGQRAAATSPPLPPNPYTGINKMEAVISPSPHRKNSKHGGGPMPWRAEPPCLLQIENAKGMVTSVLLVLPEKCKDHDGHLLS